MRKTNKKGFTIVELVIVIAVIAILAAVLIPTFISLTKKANQSADIQAVRQMNTALAVNEVTEGKSITEVYAALAEAGMTSKDYVPLTSGNYFFWLQDENRVVYTDENYKIIFPENYKEKNLKTDYDKKYFALGGVIKETSVTISANGEATVTTAEELYYLSQNATNVTKITIDAPEIFLKGANISFSVAAGKSLEITGQTNGTTLTGLVMLDSKFTDKEVGKNYASGFVAEVGESRADNTETSLTLSNITIADAQIGGLEIGGVGALVGRISQGTKNVTITNCHVKNTVVNGKNKVAALVGSVAKCDLTITNCTAENVTINCSEGESAIVVGNVYNGGTVTCNDLADVAKNCTLNLVQSSNEREHKTNVTLTYEIKNGTQETLENVTIVRVLDKELKPETTDGNARYRIFDATALITYQGSSVKSVGKAVTTAKIGNQTISINILWKDAT